eukprot:gene16045-22180_t
MYVLASSKRKGGKPQAARGKAARNSSVKQKQDRRDKLKGPRPVDRTRTKGTHGTVGDLTEGLQKFGAGVLHFRTVSRMATILLPYFCGGPDSD